MTLHSVRDAAASWKSNAAVNREPAAMSMLVLSARLDRCPRSARWAITVVALAGWGLVLVTTLGCRPSPADSGPANSGPANSGESRRSLALPGSNADSPLDASTKSEWADAVAAVRHGASDSIETSEPVGDDQIFELAGVNGLRVLRLEHSTITDHGLAGLLSCEQLEQIVLRGDPIGDEGLKSLAQLTRLEILNLPQTRVTSDGILHLSPLSKLTLLRLGSPDLDDSGIERLAAMSATDLVSLKFLHLIAPRITDRGLRSVINMRRLQSFYLDESGVTDLGLDELLTARPKLHVHINQQHSDRDPQRGHPD